jgi:hypothetical protein
VAENSETVFWNPAGLGVSTVPVFGMCHSSLYSGFSENAASFSFNLGRGYMLGCGVLEVLSGPIEGTDLEGARLPDFSSYDRETLVSFGKILLGETEGNSLSAGISFKMIQQEIENETASGYALDAGCLYRSVNNIARIGINIINAGTDMKFVEDTYHIPMGVKVGVAICPFARDMLIAADVTKYLYEDTLQKNMGLEFNFHEKLTVCAGFKMGNEVTTSPSLGFTLNAGSFSLQYAFVPGGQFGDMHRFGFTTELDTFVSFMRRTKAIIP